MNIDFSELKNKKNLLAFSAGVDSSALFFLLLQDDIPFDIAIVNYNLREEAIKELQYAKDLAKKYDKKIYIKEIILENKSNFEKKARDIRYSFFEELIEKYSYNSLLTAHQLNDKLEWFLMQLSTGAGLPELLGLHKIEKKSNYTIYKPLLDFTKNDLQNYLDINNHKYFIDKSNFDENYKRNYFRHNFSDEFINQFKQGVKHSFLYLQKDLDSLNIKTKPIFQEKELEIFKVTNDDNIDIRVIDLSLKKRGFLLTKAQRDEILRQKNITISHKINIAITNQYIFIAPKTDTTIDKKYKEFYRKLKIPKNIRAYIYSTKIELNI